MSGSMNISEEIDDIISSALGIGRSEFSDDTKLGSEGLGVDSITMVEIAELVEMNLGISISDEELEEFDGSDVQNLKAFVRKKKESDV